MEFHSHRVIANGLMHRVLEWRPLGTPINTIFLLHGFQDTATTWADVATHFALAGYRIFIPDLRGFGATERIGKGGYYHFFDYVFDVSDLVDHFCASQSILLIGHSMGGVIATLYNGTFPEKVEKLVLLEGLGPENIPVAQAPERVRSWIEGVRLIRMQTHELTCTLEEATRKLARTYPNIPQEILAKRALELTRSAQCTWNDDAEHADDLQRVWRFDPLHRTRSPLGFSKVRWNAHVQRITNPTLFVHGGLSGMHISDEDERIQCFSKIESIELEKAGHMMHWTQPHTLAKTLLEWVQSRTSVKLIQALE